MLPCCCCCPQCRSLLPACCLPHRLFKAGQPGRGYGKGTKAALLLAERAVQMFRILPALTSQMGREAAPAPNSLISARQARREGEGGRAAGQRGHRRALQDLGFLPNTHNLQTGARVTGVVRKSRVLGIFRGSFGASGKWATTQVEMFSKSFSKSNLRCKVFAEISP